jgi:hypothetical protein
MADNVDSFWIRPILLANEVTANFRLFESGEIFMDFVARTKSILTDSHFLVPFGVLLAGILLLIVLH